jgi:thiamine biosynthesis lipoprotein
MNTDVEVVLVVDRCAGDPTVEAALDEVERLFVRGEAALSRFRPDSELCALNRHAGQPFAASPLLFTVVAAALAAARATHGLFDPTVLRALEAAGYDRSFEHVAGSAAAPRRQRRWAAGGWDQIHLDPDPRRISLPRGCGLDLGGIAKGWTVDQAARELAARGFNSYAVDAGGDLYVAGQQVDGRPWLVGVEDPRAPGRDLLVLQRQDGAVATSSSHRRRWRRDGRERHHLIDPRTGQPSDTGVLAATVLAPSVARAEILAKAALLLGPRDGMRFLEQQADAAGLLVLEDGRTVQSMGLAPPRARQVGYAT